jgi:hypothetical protein
MSYWSIFWELLKTPFTEIHMIWGIVPLYFGWLLNELTSSKASFQTAVQTGFAFVWSGAHWSWQYSQNRPFLGRAFELSSPTQNIDLLLTVNVMVTLFVFLVGLLALYCGLRRKFPHYLSFLGHSRFSNYFMISIFPIQSRALDWSWDRLIAILLFALPVWALVHLILLPLRK